MHCIFIHVLFIRHLNECNECVDYNSQWLMLLFVNIDNKYSVSLSLRSLNLTRCTLSLCVTCSLRVCFNCTLNYFLELCGGLAPLQTRLDDDDGLFSIAKQNT